MQINFPAVTVCPRIVHGDRSWENFRHRFEKHTIKKVKYEYEESKQEFADQERFGNISNVEFLDRIENGSIDPRELATKT